MRATTRFTFVTVLALTIAVSGCDPFVFDDFCKLYGPVGGDDATQIDVKNNSSNGNRVRIVPVGAVDPCGQRDLASVSSVAEDAFVAGGATVAVVFGPEFIGAANSAINTMPGPGETDSRELTCDQVGAALAFGPTIWQDTANQQILAIAGAITFFRQKGNDFDYTRLYQCGDRLELEADDSFVATGRVYRDDAVIATQTVNAVQVKQSCEPSGEIDPNDTFILLTWSEQNPTGFSDRTYQLFAMDGTFYLARLDQYFVTPFSPALSAIFGSSPRVEVDLMEVQALFDTLEANCIFDLPSDANGGYFYGVDHNAQTWFVAASRGLFQNELYIDDDALALDHRYQAIVDALEQIVENNGGG